MKTLLFAIIITSLSFGLINLIRSNIYDWRQLKLRRELALHPHARHLRKRPLMSLIIFAENDVATIMACLQSIVQSSYRKTEIIIVDNASRDMTKSLIKDFIKAHPKQSLRLVAKKQPATRAAAIASARKYAKGELIAVLDASCVLGKDSLRSAVVLRASQDFEAVLPNVHVDHGYRLFGLVGQLRAISSVWYKKAGSYIGPNQDTYNIAVVYSRQLFLKAVRPSKQAGLDNLNALRQLSKSIAYDSCAIVSTYKTAASAPANLTLLHPFISLRGLLALLEPLVISFMAVVAIKFNNPGYLFLAWLSFTCLLLLAVWTDESRSVGAKLNASLLALISYGLYIWQSLINLAKLCIGLIKKINYRPSFVLSTRT